MAIFRNRPLALACIALIVSVAFFFVLPFSVSLILAISLIALLVAFALLFGWRQMKWARILVLLIALLIALGAARALIERHYSKKLLGSNLGKEVTATLEVEEIYNRSVYGSTLLVKLSDLNGTPCHAKALLITDDLTPFYLRDRISGTFYCGDLEATVLYEGQVLECVSDGAYVSLSTTKEGNVELLNSGNSRFTTRLSDFREILRFRLTALVKGERGELLSALLLGTRDSLDACTARDFRRVGISHILALSGLHLTILLGIADKFLSWLHIGKRWRILILTVFSFGYLLLTGFSYSMLRAVLMLTFLRLSFFVKEDYDAFTALSVGGAIMVLITPYAVFDLSFQMTMLATFGILSFGGLQARLVRWIPRRKGALGIVCYLLRAALSSLLITVSATVAILPVQWLQFGEISLLSPMANLLMIPLATGALLLGLFLLILLWIPVIATLIAAPTGWITALMLKLVGALSPLDGMLSLRYDFVPYILIPFFVITAILLVTDLKKLDFLVLSPMLLTIAAFVVCLSASHHIGKEQLTLIYRNTGSNEGVLLVQNDTAMICDVSNGSYTQLYEDYRLLQQYCATEIEVLMLTHYHNKQITSISRFCDTAMLRSLWLPMPTTDADKAILAELLALAAEKRIPVTVYSHDTLLTVFETGNISLSAPLFEKRSVEPAFAISLSFGEKTLLYQSAALSEYERLREKESRMTGDYLILGSHGPVPHEKIDPALQETPLEIVIGNEKALLQYEGLYDSRYIVYPEVKTYLFE